MIKRYKISSSAEERIVVAATKIFVTKGLAGARIRQIATEANTNSAMIYYYYRSKQNLFSLVFENALEKFLPPSNYLAQNDLDIFSKIEILCDELMEVQISNPYISAFILNEIEKNPAMLKEEILHKQKEKIQLFSREVQRNINNKTIRKIEPVQLFMNIVSLCIFPFIAKPLFTQLFSIKPNDMADIMRIRKVEVKNIVIHSLKYEINSKK
ncbi:TetR family transcriptional regulator [soil metagenome]